MASLKAAALALLNDDSSLTAVFTGGFFDEGTLPNRGMTFDNIPKEADGITIRPTGVLRWRGPNMKDGPSYAATWYVEIYLYDDGDQGREKLDYAKRRIWELLNKHYMGNTDHEGFAYFIWLGDLGEVEGSADDDVLTANMDRMRFQVDITRK